MSLMSEIRAFPVPKKSVAIWWLGQTGYIFKTPEGTLATTDMYLTNSCAAAYPGLGLDLNRRVPVLIPPKDLDVDIYTCTHNHQDHTDPETIRGLRHRDTTHFVGPHPTCEVYRAEGIETGRIVPAWPACELELRDIHIRGAFALPTDDTDLNHMGYIFTFAGGPKIYVTGDTDFSDLLFSAARFTPSPATARAKYDQRPAASSPTRLIVGALERIRRYSSAVRTSWMRASSLVRL